VADRLAGKTAVVTGASRGLGLAVARAFEAEGARVIKAAKSSGVDVSQPEDVARLFQQLERLDILVQCAGVLTPRKHLWDVTTEEWRASIDVNLNGVFFCMREALHIMIRQKSGWIVNVGSGVSNRAAPTWGPYAAAKWGVEGLTKLAAEEGREHGVHIVSVNPGRMRTTMRAIAYPDEDPSTLKTPEDTAGYFVDVVIGKIPFTTGELLQVEQK